ncbi:molybdenum cofactor guanylyltransferase [Cryobacterium soli]|uniref:molybdenum cofactor guanylyltransferase n=1 Tax=Cryobacterium soli TaxID=2220095 RepID=UPI000E745DA4|nr:NTP transferase domain-containing protein [Cryobacterium soli]
MDLSDEPDPDLPWDALVVAGGRARRLGGIDKTALIWGGRSLLDGVLSATRGARRVCVVGSDARLPASVLRTVERPRWAGPAAAIVAGLDMLTVDSDDAGECASDWIVVLAADLVRADAAVAVLLTQLEHLCTDRAARDGLIAVDRDGRRQPLLAVYRREALHAAVAAFGPADNLSVIGLIGPLDLVETSLPDEIGADVDTPADAARLGIEVPHDTADADLGPAHDSARP